ncbi:hypothetical protein B0H17DRAFT_1141383 [Mycena rosella]|uniref:Uncharacterized protein n=1 Tax=Mycena rosella TaxID=1033263 RepID=A0AAD7D007_MYCRO|nr:hypothetical protein B0H17DRAFT_1141383 [Mycena rosella]
MHFGSRSPEPELARHHVEGTIFFYHDILQDICLQPEDLDDYPWCPQEPWSMFFEKCLRPAVYFFQAAVTHDFTLVGWKGIYGKVELEEINFWLSQILLHCRLLLLSCLDMAALYLDDWAVPFPPDWEIPGEAMAIDRRSSHARHQVHAPAAHLRGVQDSHDVQHTQGLSPLQRARRPRGSAPFSPREEKHVEQLGVLGGPSQAKGRGNSASLLLKLIRVVVVTEKWSRDRRANVSRHFYPISDLHKAASLGDQLQKCAKASLKVDFRDVVLEVYPLTGASKNRLTFVPFFHPRLSVVKVVIAVPLPSRFVSRCGPAAEASRALMQNASYAGFSQTAGFPQAFLPLSSILDASPTVSSSICARFCSTLVPPPPLPFALEAVMAPELKNAALSKKLSRIHKRKCSESESAHLTDHKGGGEGEVEEEEETSPPPSRGATSRSKMQAKSPEHRQPARGTKGAMPAPSSSSKPSAKRSRTAARAVNPILPPSKLAKLAAARASPPPKNAPDSALSIPLRRVEAETSLSHRFLEFCLPENFPPFMVLPSVNDASFGFPLTVLSPNDPTNLPSYDDANLRRYFKELLSMRDAARAAPWESFEAGDWHMQLFAAHIVAFSDTSTCSTDSTRQSRPINRPLLQPTILLCWHEPALPRHKHEPFAEFVPYVEGRLMAPNELWAAHTQYSKHHRVETDCRDRLYNDLFAKYTSTLGKWEPRKVEVVAELDAREQSRAKAVERYLSLRSGSQLLASPIPWASWASFWTSARSNFSSASEEKSIGAIPQSQTRSSSSGSSVLTGGACLAPLPISYLDDNAQTDDSPEAEVDQLAPVVDNEKRCPARAKGKGKEKERTAIHPLLYDVVYHSGEPMNWAVPSFPPDMCGHKSKSKTVPEPERLLTHGWQWSRIAGMHRFAKGMETEGIALRWLPALFYFTRGPGCTSCHDHNWACVRYYDGPDLVAACVRCLDQCHACTLVADFDFAYTDGRVLLLNHRLFEAIIRNNTWLFSEVLGSDMVDKLKALAIVMSDGNICPPVDHGDWTPREYGATPPTTELGGAAAAVASIAKAAVACRPFLATAQASDADSLKQVTGMLSELAHVFETTSNDLNSFLAMRNVRATEQAASLMSPNERMDDPEDNRNAWESDVPGLALSRGMETGVKGWDNEEGAGGGADTTGGSGGAGTSLGARASDDVEMRDIESCHAPRFILFFSRRPATYSGTLKIPTGANALSFRLPGTVLGARGSLLAGVLIAPPRVHPSLPPQPPTPAPSKTPPTLSAVVPSTEREPETPEAPLPQGAGSEGAGEGSLGASRGRGVFRFVFQSALVPEPPQ